MDKYQEDTHPLDAYELEAENSREEFVKQALLDASLVFAVFSTPPGRELLARWCSLLVNEPTARQGDDLLTIGINEGHKAFIRSLIRAVKIHEDQPS